jgi:hypothetical protein
MSLSTLASKIYTVKSRKNLSLPTAFASLVREDLAMRYSVFNMVKAVTRSDFIATVAQAKYGKKTPIESEEESQLKKKLSQEKKFNQFTVNSIVNLNRKIDALTAITERNSALVLNLYNDLGSFKNKRADNLNQINNLTAVRLKVKSRTVKYQIDEIKTQLEALKAISIGKKASKKLKNAAATGMSAKAAAAAAIAGGGTNKVSAGDSPTPPTEQKPDGTKDSMMDVASDLLTTYGLSKLIGSGYRFIRKKYFPTPSAGTATPVQPTTTTTATKSPVWNEKAQRWTDPATKKFVAAPKTAAKVPPAPSSAKFGLGKLLRGVGKIFGTGPQTIALIMQGAGEMASGRAGAQTLDEMQQRVKRFGIKFGRSKDGTPLYFINGETYTSENLPPEYQTILDAYVGDNRSASARAAQQRMQSAPAFYNSLIVEGPPVFQESETAARVIAAAKAAQLSTPEPKMIGAESIQLGAPETKTGTAQGSTVPTLPSVSYTPGKPVETETVKQIIVNAANIVGVDPGIMLAMGQQESSFNPNAVPYDKKTGKLLSSAKGLFQFIDKTWKHMVDKYSKEYPELSRGPFDPMANALAGALYVKENSKILKNKKIPITGTSIYATHFLGPGGASKLFSAPKQSLAVNVLPDAAKSNPHIFMKGNGTSKTIGEVIDTLYFKVGQKAETFAAEVRNKPQMYAYTPGVAVSSMPTPTTAPASSTSSMVAEVKSEAAIQANKVIQDAIVALAPRISDLESQVNLDRPFPSVRNAASVG